MRRALWSAGYRYRKNVAALPGCPDLVFVGPRVAVFCDGDFWHGRDWEARLPKLARGANAAYWVAKIRSNMERDLATTRQLESLGWAVVRLWESDVIANPGVAAAEVIRSLNGP